MIYICTSAGCTVVKDKMSKEIIAGFVDVDQFTGMEAINDNENIVVCTKLVYSQDEKQ